MHTNLPTNTPDQSLPCRFWFFDLCTATHLTSNLPQNSPATYLPTSYSSSRSQLLRHQPTCRARHLSYIAIHCDTLRIATRASGIRTQQHYIGTHGSRSRAIVLLLAGDSTDSKIPEGSNNVILLHFASFCADLRNLQIRTDFSFLFSSPVLEIAQHERFPHGNNLECYFGWSGTLRQAFTDSKELVAFQDINPLPPPKSRTETGVRFKTFILHLKAT
ncbi:hypothetical protein QBC35DRAFT_293271 [Podospora australis]|uniref:Uncharacterized protein n=1 Tax=Podospora australis TaxID=1536484 RepID=A0AAN6X0Y1_9PEZI|nr:hypothetical protein QBC35DRAFT_293271 [Podospora australis]